MEAGRELDALIAEKVMGKTVRSKNEVTNNAFKPEYDELVVDLGNERYEFIRHYSTDIADAWKVLKKLIQLGAEINVGFYKQWDCSIDYPIGCNWLVQAETAPLAICLAALEAVGGGDYGSS